MPASMHEPLVLPVWLTKVMNNKPAHHRFDICARLLHCDWIAVSYLESSTVEPLLKDTLNKGHNMFNPSHKVPYSVVLWSL